MHRAEEIADVENEQFVAKVAAIDVAKASGMVCTRLPHPAVAGCRVTNVWQVSTTTNAILELADHLAGLGIERVVVESTSTTGGPFVYVLEAAGVPAWLVTGHDVKNVPGRPRPTARAVWLAKLTVRGMLGPSSSRPGNPGITRLHPVAGGTWSGNKPGTRNGWKAARRRPDQTLYGGHRHHGHVRTSDGRGTDHLRTRPPRARCPGPEAVARQTPGTDPGPGRTIRRSPCRAARIVLDAYDALNAQIDTLTTRIEGLISQLRAAAAPEDQDEDDDQAPTDEPPLPVHGAAGRDPWYRPTRRADHNRRDRVGHDDPFPRRRPSGVLGQTVPAAAAAASPSAPVR